MRNESGHSSNTSYPDLYSCSRQERPLIDGSIVDPESPDLPDFVQDHLAVEHMYFNDGTNVQSVNVQNLPDFACLLRDESNEARHCQRLGRLTFKFTQICTKNYYILNQVGGINRRQSLNSQISTFAQ